MATVGEQFATVVTNSDDIHGVTVSVRQHDNIVQLWNKDASADFNVLLTKMKQLLPNAEISKAFYKRKRQTLRLIRDTKDHTNRKRVNLKDREAQRNRKTEY